jgi:hypothetical protein
LRRANDIGTNLGSGESEGGAGIFTPLEAEGFPARHFPHIYPSLANPFFFPSRPSELVFGARLPAEASA